MEAGPSEPKPKKSTKGKQYLLFGKIFTQISYTASMLLTSLYEIWYQSSIINVKTTEIQNVFKIEFSSVSDIRYGMNGAPWEIGKSLYILKSWKPGKTLE